MRYDQKQAREDGQCMVSMSDHDVTLTHLRKQCIINAMIATL